MSRVNILGVPIDAVTALEAIERIRCMLESNAQHHVMTPNSEMLVEATRNPPFRDLLNRTALNLPDSAGLLLGAKMTGQRLSERVTGVDTVRNLCCGLDEHTPVFFLGTTDAVREKATVELWKCNSHFLIAGHYGGSPRAEEADAIIERINASGAHLLLVAYGAPQQDLWIDAYLSKLTTVRVAIGVGGTLDFIAGVQKRAPLWMRSLGLEWLWRVIREPRRIGRIWKAVVVFPWLVITKHSKPEALHS